MVLSLSNSTKTTRNLISLLMYFAVFCENWHHFFLKSLLFVGAQAVKWESCRGSMQHYFVGFPDFCALLSQETTKRARCKIASKKNTADRSPKGFPIRGVCVKIELILGQPGAASDPYRI